MLNQQTAATFDTNPGTTVISTVPPRDGLRGYQVHAIHEGAPLPGRQKIVRVEDYGSDSHLLVVGSNGRKHYMSRHTEIRLLDTGAVLLVNPEYSGWASD